MKPRDTTNGATGAPLPPQWSNAAEMAGRDWQATAGRLIIGQITEPATGAPRLLGHGGGVRVQDDRNLATIAGPRSGKGETCIRPNLLTYSGSMFIIDPKGEHAALERQTNARAKMGHQVFILNPFDVPAAGLGVAFNPFDELDRNAPDFFDKLAVVVDALIVSSDKSSPFWDLAATDLIKLLVLWMYFTPETGAASLARLYRVLSGAEISLTDEHNEDGSFRAAGLISIARHQEVDPELAAMAGGFDGHMGQTFENIRMTAKTQLSFLFGMRGLESSAFRLRDLKRKPTTIYLVLPASKLGTHYKWLRLILMLAVEVMESEPNTAQDVVFLLEEFAALGRVSIIERCAALMPGFGMKLWFILQDLSQIRALYPQSWETLLDSCGTIQAFGNAGETTLKWLSARLGDVDVFDLKHAGGGSADARSGTFYQEQIRRLPLMPPEAIRLTFARNSPDRLMLLLRKDHKPAQVSRLPFGWVPK